MRTVSKNNYSCTLAISFSIATKFSPINTSVFFLFFVFFLAKLGFSRFIISIRLWNLINKSTYFNLEKSLMAHYVKEPSFVKHMIVGKKKEEEERKDYPITFLLLLLLVLNHSCCSSYVIRLLKTFIATVILRNLRNKD